MTSGRTFLDSLRAYGFIDEPQPSVRPTGPVGVRDEQASGAYLRAAVEREAEKVRTTTEGSRSHELNTAAYSLGQLVAGAGLDEQTVRDALVAASFDNGHIRDDGERAIHNTITSGLTAGKKEPRGIPELRPVDYPSIAPFDVTLDPEALSAKIRERFPIIDWDALWADESEEEWIVEPILPARRLVALYSAPKIGKSLLMLELAASIASGRPVLGTSPDPRRVLYVDFENDPKADIRERLQAMRFSPADLTPRLFYLSYPTIAGLDSERGGEELMAAVVEYQAEVVVIDTVSRAIAGEENENDTWLSFYRHTGLKLKKAQVSLVRLDHSGKDETKGQRGGSAKSGDVDAVWRLSRITDDSYRLDCEAARMPIVEKTLVLHRELYPLRHRVDAEGRAAANGLKVDAAVKALNDAHAPKDIGMREAQELVRATGLKVRNDLIREAVKKWRLGLWISVPHERGTDLEITCAPTDGARSGTED